MTKASDNAFPSVLITEGTEPSAPAAGKQRLYIDSTSHHLMRTNSSGTETDIESAAGGVAVDSIWDAAGDLAVGTGANTAARLGVGALGTWAISTGTTLAYGPPGYPVALTVPVPLTTWTTNTNASADFGWAAPIIVPGPMYVRGLSLEFTASAAGTYQWGLFDYSASVTAATKTVGGNAAPGGTGWRSIPADGAPVLIKGGAYMLIWKSPAATVSTIRTITMASSTAVPWNQIWTAYTWDDTPDLTSASWVANTTFPVMYLEGDLDASGNRWT
jgi:hypothetical protein